MIHFSIDYSEGPHPLMREISEFNKLLELPKNNIYEYARA